jgi:hypothetical protein
MKFVNSSDNGLSSGLVFRTRFQLENEIIFRPKHDPDKPPPLEPGDIYIVLGTAIGLVVLGSVGFLISLLLGMSNPFVPIAAGVIIGGIIGSILGERLKKRVQRQRLARWKKIFQKVEKDMKQNDTR